MDNDEGASAQAAWVSRFTSCGGTWCRLNTSARDTRGQIPPDLGLEGGRRVHGPGTAVNRPSEYAIAGLRLPHIGDSLQTSYSSTPSLLGRVRWERELDAVKLKEIGTASTCS